MRTIRMAWRDRVVHRFGGGERGAAAVEYALLVGLVAIVLIAGTQRLEAAERSELQSKQSRAGAPDLNGTAAPTSTPGSTTAPPSDPSGTSPPPTTVKVTPTVSQTTQGSNWTVTISLKVTDPGDRTVTGATVSGTWSVPGAAPQCPTDSNGVCTVTVTVNKNSYSQLTLTVDSVTGPGVTASPPYPTVTVVQS